MYGNVCPQAIVILVAAIKTHIELRIKMRQSTTNRLSEKGEVGVC